MKTALFFLLFTTTLWAQEAPPKQEMLDKPLIISDKKGYTIEALATFELTARVLSTEDYHWGKEADLSPRDFALGWQEMSSPEFLSKIKITQGGRFYYWYTKDPSIYAQKDKIISRSANMHLIPADKKIEKILDKSKQGHNIYLKGYLVRASQGNWQWKSSLTRDDSGAGACELFYVTEATRVF